MRHSVRLLLAAVFSTAATGAGAQRLPVVELTARDYAFAGPDSVASGAVVLRLRNAGREGHQASVYRLAPGTSYDSVLQTLLMNRRRPAGVIKVGGVEAVEPGKTAEVEMVLVPGRYVVACGLPSPDGRAHVTRGMVRGLTVTPSRRPARLPPADLSVRMTEYAYAFSSPPRAGRQRWRVVNAGAQPHQLMLSRMHPGKTLREVDAWDGHSPPPFDPPAGVAVLDPGQENVWTANLAPGDYLVSCLVADAGDHRPHWMHGMEQVVHVPAARR